MMPTEKTSPFIININKPKGITSYDVIRLWKPRLKKLGKVGHFGTLDPFASGVLMLGVAGAQRLNEYIHECFPKTYLAKGILGQETETGDLTAEISQVDESEYLKNTISNFEKSFIENQLKEKFLGDYLQSPHKYSATKHEGKALHQWAREGVEIKKEQVLRHIHSIEVVKYEFPDLWIRVVASSGTYIRTLFSECANHLGTIGVLEDLIREKVGGCTLDNSISEPNWSDEDFQSLAMDTVLDFSSLIMAPKEAGLYQNGVRLNSDRALEISPGTLDAKYFWVRSEDKTILGLAEIINDQIVSKANF